METLEGLREQLATVDELHAVVRTMKGLAGSRIRRYEAAVSSLEHYARTIDLSLQVLLRDRPRLPETLRSADGTRLAAVVLGSDQGMCGPFSRRIAEHAVGELAPGAAHAGTTTAAGPAADPLVLAVGHRAATELQAAGLVPAEQVALPSSVEGITDAVRDLLVRIDRWRRDEDVARVTLIHHQPVSRVVYRPRSVPIVPLDPRRLERLRERRWEGPSLPRRFGPRDVVLRSLVRQDLFIALFRAFASSQAAENGARLAAMQAAERNITDRAERLEQRYHRRRQMSITEELLDVVSGWRAIEEG